MVERGKGSRGREETSLLSLIQLSLLYSSFFPASSKNRCRKRLDAFLRAPRSIIMSDVRLGAGKVSHKLQTAMLHTPSPSFNIKSRRL